MSMQADGITDADVRIAIVGSGFAGIGTAVNLKRSGIDDFVVLERAEDVGGTWRENSYPGCQCDVPSTLYSFSFAPNPEWTRTYPLQQEIWDYLRKVTRDEGITHTSASAIRSRIASGTIKASAGRSRPPGAGSAPK